MEVARGLPAWRPLRLPVEAEVVAIAQGVITIPKSEISDHHPETEDSPCTMPKSLITILEAAPDSHCSTVPMLCPVW